MGRALRRLLLTAFPWRPWGRTGLRLHCHLPFGVRGSPRASLTDVVVTLGDEIVVVIVHGDHQPAFVPLPAGRHDLVVQLRGLITIHATCLTTVDVVPDVVETYELVRRTRWRGTSPRNLPLVVARRRSGFAR